MVKYCSFYYVEDPRSYVCNLSSSHYIYALSS